MSSALTVEKQIQDTLLPLFAGNSAVHTFGGGGYSFVGLFYVLCILLFPLTLHALSGVPKLGLNYASCIFFLSSLNIYYSHFYDTKSRK